jgi:PAS domain S-box-containing protein
LEDVEQHPAIGDSREERAEQALRDSEEALRESERKYRELVEHANSIILHWSRDGRIIFLNEFGQRFFGYSEEEIRGRHVMGTIVPENESGGRDLRPLMDEICRNPEAFEQNVNENIRRNGERVWVAWTNKVVLDAQGQVTEILSIGADITRRKHAEERVLRLNQLYAALSRLNQIVGRASDRQTLFRETCRIAVEHGQFRMAWIGLVDEATALVRPEAFAGEEQGYLTSLTIAYQDERLARGPTGTAIREGRCDLCHDIATDPRTEPWRAEALRCGFRASAAVPLRQEGRVIGALSAYAEEARVFDAEEEALLIEIGQVISYALDGLVREAQRRQAEENLQRLNRELEQRVSLRTSELNAMNEQLRAKNSELKGFAYTVSHDLKAPLRGIAGYASELDRKHRTGLSERAQFCLRQILTATANLDHLIEDLLHYSRLDSETPSATTVDVRELVAIILRDRQLTLQQQQVEVTVDIPFSALQAWERGLIQVMTNLIDNAIKYSRKAEPPRVHIAAMDLDDTWRLTVKDNGIGFDMKYHDRIFGLFNRLVRVEEFEGTGAGLAIVRKILDKMHGSIRAESSPGAGATFIVDLPKRESAT